LTTRVAVRMVAVMGMMDRGFVHREIRRMAQALALVSGRRRNGEDEAARQELASVREEWLGPVADLVDRVDVDTAVTLLRDATQVWAYAALTWESGQLDGDPGKARRALALGHRAVAMQPGLPGVAEELQRWAEQPR